MPVGFASAARETAEETALPEPGNKRYFVSLNRQYERMFDRIRSLLEHVCRFNYFLDYFQEANFWFIILPQHG